MPADTLTGWTLERLLIELADELGLAEYGSGADNSAVVPADPNLRDQLTRAVNRGYRAFLNANPRWTFLERPLRLTLSPDGTAGECIDSDPGRYLMPSFVTGNPKGDWTFVDDLGDKDRIIAADALSVRRMRDRTTGTSGTPAYGAVRPLEPAAGGTQKAARHELLLFPDPDLAYIIEAEFRITAHDLSDLADRHIAGAEHDLAVLEQAIWQFRKQDNPSLPQPRERLAESIVLDNASRPRRAGEMRSTFQTGGPGDARLSVRRTILVNDQPI